MRRRFFFVIALGRIMYPLPFLKKMCFHSMKAISSVRTPLKALIAMEGISCSGACHRRSSICSGRKISLSRLSSSGTRLVLVASVDNSFGR